MFGESFREAWRLRYGAAPAFDLPELAPFLTHRSVRRYADREVPETLVEALVACAQSAATSSSLQLYSIVSVQDPVRRARMAELCDNQRQVADAPWFFAFLADHHRLRRIAKELGTGGEGLDYLEFLLMAGFDAALAAERMVCAAEAMGLGICYIGALRNDPPGVRELLELPDGVFGTFGLCLGYPAEDAKAEIKPRLPQASVWFRERYDAEAPVAEYDDRMRAFYESQRMKGDVTWSMRSARRTDEHHLTGREVLMEWLRAQGMGTR
ncbi:MAG: NADPH-dependent oxidoreductase [Fimbriimonas sp.]